MKRMVALLLILCLAMWSGGCKSGEMQRVDDEPSVQNSERPGAESSDAVEKEKKDPALAPLEEVLLEPIERRILLPVDQEKMEELGITVTAGDIRISQQTLRDIMDTAGELDFDTAWTMLPESVYKAGEVTLWGEKEAGFPFAFDLTLTQKNGETVTFAVEADAYYNGELTGNIKPVWGSISVVDKDTIALSTLQDITFYSSTDFSVDVGKKLNLSAFEGRSYTANAVTYHSALGYVVPMYVDGNSYLAIFGEDGNLQGSHLLSKQEGRGLSNDPITYLTYFGQASVIDLDVPVIVFEDKGYSGNHISFFRTDDYKEVKYAPFFDMDNSMGAKNYFALGENERVYLYSTSETEGAPYNGAVNGIVAVYKTGMEQGGYAQFGTDIPIRWDFGVLREGDNAEVASFDKNSGVFSLYSAAGGQSLTVNFTSGSGSLVFDIREESLESQVDSSPNMRYQLWQANSSAMGDAYWGNLALKDTQTGTITYVGEYGSGYITTPMDFLGDDRLIYKPLVMDMVFIRTADGEVYQEVALTYADTVEGRVSFNATYDAQTDRYFVAYIDGNTDDNYPRDFSAQNYSVAVFNARGEQTGTILTEIPGSIGPIYSLYCPPMKVTEDTLWLDGKAVDIAVRLEV